MKKGLLYICLLSAAVLWSCSGDRELFSPDDVGVLGVDAMLYVDQPLPSIRLYRAQSPTEPFNISNAAERGATVLVRSPTAVARYIERSPGMYIPAATYPRVAPETVYHLEVTSVNGERLAATTTTPPRLSVSDWVLLDETGTTVERRLKTFAELGDGVYTAPENQLNYTQGLLEAWVKPVETAAYQAGIYSLDPDSGFVFDPAFLDEEDFEEFEPNVASPPILNSETKIRLPWFAIYFKYRYKIKIFAIDKNWFDLARSVPELAGGGGGFGGNAGDNFERPIFNVLGGIGVFGSASVDSVGFTVHPRP
ncbi:MAG: DUF4249 family protein [Candidatus Latescibacterota bacterium]|jgi:hypothetical protein